jgi:hypothetical protein
MTLLATRPLARHAAGIDRDPAAIAETQQRLAQGTLDPPAELVNDHLASLDNGTPIT